ncbi:MAG: aminopeptidase [Gammaproteobacteria bacterium]|nr:aminopeptidase [Gammaproteobacteria bacterium]
MSYYSQAIGGHLSLLSQRQQIDKLLDDEQLERNLRERLTLSQQILTFAEQEMALPNKGSYRHFVRVNGRYVVWNVIAAPEFSVEAEQWCYPFAGCVTYRGYYAEQDASVFARGLNKQGLDTTVAGASAYSTLGWLDDPLFSSMMYRDEARLVEVMIHELAHQRLYISGNTVFNESFASVVAREGVRRWFKYKHAPKKYEEFLHSEKMEQIFNQLLMQTRGRLQWLYASTATEEQKRSAKTEIFATMQAEYRALQSKGVFDGRYDNWMARPLNNANLALVAAYHQLEPELELLLERQAGNMEQFYQQAAKYEDAAINNKIVATSGK